MRHIRDLTSWWRSWACVLIAGFVSCTPSSEGRQEVQTPAGVPPSGPGGGRPEVRPAPSTAQEVSELRMTRVRVGNYDPRGVEDQPDYHKEAEHLRRSMDRRLPDRLPTVEGACRDMLDAVQRYYRVNETERERRASLAHRFRVTRRQDLSGCIRDTSPAAAVCTTLLLRRQEAEFPWLLDQCSRAYPREEAPAR